jgi:hypothetical protein
MSWSERKQYDPASSDDGQLPSWVNLFPELGQTTVDLPNLMFQSQELATYVAALFQPVGVDKAGRIVVRILLDRVNEASFVIHRLILQGLRQHPSPVRFSPLTALA